MNEKFIHSLYNNKLKNINKNSKLLENKNFIRRVVKINNQNIIYASKKLLKDEDFFLELFRISFSRLNLTITCDFESYYNNLSDSMKKNEKFLFELIKINYFFFKN